MRTVCVLFAMLLLLAVQAQAGKGNYPGLVDKISYDVREILIKHGMSVRHDRENGWFYQSGSTGSYTISFFKADEIPLAAKLETIQYCMELYEEKKRKERFRIKMYRETLKEENRLFSGVKPFFELTIGGNN